MEQVSHIQILGTKFSIFNIKREIEN